MKKMFYLTLCISLIQSCAWFEGSEQQKIIGEYEVAWHDLESNRSINKLNSEIIVGGYVFAVGHNDSSIIAKQHPNFRPDTEYYIVELSKNRENSRKGIYGPLTEMEFTKKKVKLNIEKLGFDLNFKEHPSR